MIKKKLKMDPNYNNNNNNKYVSNEIVNNINEILCGVGSNNSSSACSSSGNDSGSASLVNNTINNFYDAEKNCFSSVGFDDSHNNIDNKNIENCKLNFIKEYVTIKSEEIYLEGIINYNEKSKGIIIFVHGIGSSRFSPRNLFLSKYFQNMGYSTLLFDLLTPQEERLNNITGEFKYNLNFISNRILNATQFIIFNQKLKHLDIIYFGSSTGSAGIIECEKKVLSLGIKIKSIISRSGRLSLCNDNSIKSISTRILLVCGGDDKETLENNKLFLNKMNSRLEKKLAVILNATHLFPEENALENVASITLNFLNSSTL
ncbi:hypothetical protein RB653_009894 [Dictyostelium firmibasis]|uniref:KANL3/Tex30 alpha/beta hydrolase-like domain-containing protein n=1 Tax=Dictyostelium firmibasis TaxID=79012 RepID=A0AAN7YP37_9MYCE